MSLQKLKHLIFPALFCALILPLPAQSPEERGLAIARESDRRDTGFGDTISMVEMVLKNSRGESSTRKMRVDTLEQSADGDKSLVVFDFPPDIKDTALLTFTHRKGPDDQWLYLPSLERVKRIASSNQSGPFVGSEFAYEDISSQEVEKYTYRYLRDETHQGMSCFVMERYPENKKSGYTKQVVWVDKAHYRQQKLDFYDRKGALLKTLQFHGFRQYQGKFWRADKLSMVNHQTGKSTDLIVASWKFGNNLSESDFDLNSLKKAR